MNCSYVLSGCQICGCFSYQYFMKVNIENMNTLHTRKLGLIPQSFMGGVLPNDFFFCSSFIIYHLLLRSDLLFQVKKISCVSVVTHLNFLLVAVTASPVMEEQFFLQTSFTHALGRENRIMFPNTTTKLHKLQWPGNKSQDPVQNCPQNVHPSKERHKWYKEKNIKIRQTCQQRSYKDRGNRRWRKKG